MEAAMTSGQQQGEAAMREAMVRLYLDRDRPDDALKFATAAYTSAKKIESGAAPPSVSDARTAKLLADAGAAVGSGSEKEAMRAAREAFAAARSQGDRGAETLALKLLVGASFVKRDVDEALRAAKELAKLARGAGDKAAEASAACGVAEVHLANADPAQAILAAEAALALAKEAGDKAAQATAFGTICMVHGVMGKPAQALKAAKEVPPLVAGDRRSEAAAALMAADAHPASKESLAAARDAVAKFRELGDKGGEAAATVALAYSHLSQAVRQYDDGVAAAKGAVTLFKEAGDAAGTGLAQSVVALACSLRDDAQGAQDAAKEALQTFRGVNHKVGESHASHLLSRVPMVGVKQSQAKLFFDHDVLEAADKEGILAHIELNEMATQESLEGIVSTLHNWSNRDKGKYLKGVIVHVEGLPAPASMHSHVMSTGAFLIGIRTLGVPIFTATSGTVAGPTWGLMLMGDYRIISADATFVTPILRPVECLFQLVGQGPATHLTMGAGTVNSSSLLEMGVCHQLQQDRETTSKAAAEQAKRIACWPALAARQTLTLMQPDAERYAFVQ